MNEYELTVEINSRGDLHQPTYTAGNTVIMITPSIDEDFWWLRVPVSENQAIVAFPKFGTIGVGFQIEKNDWNTNLPYNVYPTYLYNHIKDNKGDDSIPDEKCIEAIKLIQETVRQLWPGHDQELFVRMYGSTRVRFENGE